MAAPKDTSHIFCCDGTHPDHPMGFWCQNCNLHGEVELPISIDNYVKLSKAFVHAHADCQPPLNQREYASKAASDVVVGDRVYPPGMGWCEVKQVGRQGLSMSLQLAQVKRRRSGPKLEGTFMAVFSTEDMLEYVPAGEPLGEG